MHTVHLNPSADLKSIALRLFGYRGNQFKVRVSDTYHLENYWSEGSIKKCQLIKRDGFEVLPPSAKTTNPMNAAAHQTVQIPPGYFIVEHHISSGNDRGITFICNPVDMDTFTLPPVQETTDDEMIVLVFTRAYKPSYNGISNYRFHNAKETGITLERWETAKASLIARKLLQKNGAITPDGRNIAGTTDPYILRLALAEKKALAIC